VSGPGRRSGGADHRPAEGSSGERLYRGAVRAFSAVFVVVGLAVLVVTLANGGGPASVGFLLGIAFVAIGAGRFWVGERMGR
jgi:hypothetical protein